MNFYKPPTAQAAAPFPQRVGNLRTAPPPAAIELPKSPIDRMLDTNQVAAILGLSAETLKKWRQRGIGPAYVRYGNGTVRYRLSVIMKYLEDNTSTPRRP